MNNKSIKLFSKTQKILILISSCFINYHSLSQNSSYSNSLANSTVATENFWSIFCNPAGMIKTDKITAGISVENRFLLKELKYYSIGLLLPTKWGHTGLTFHHSGFNLFHTYQIGLSYARRLGSGISTGLKLYYLRYSYPEERRAHHLASFDLGIIFYLNSSLNIGIQVLSPVNAIRNSKYKITQPTIVRAGLAYLISSELLFLFEIDKALQEKISLRSGFEYSFRQQIFIRAGLRTQPTQFSFGIGLKYSGLVIDMASSYNTILGFSPSISVLKKLAK